MALEFVPETWGANLKTKVGSASLIEAGPGRIHFRTGDIFLVGIFLMPVPRHHTTLGGVKRIISSVPSGGVEIVPARTDFSASWETLKRKILLGFPETALRELAEGELGRPFDGLHPVAAWKKDDEALAFARLLHALLQNEAQDRSETERTMSDLALYLLRRYGDKPDDAPLFHAAGLPPYLWRKLDDYMRENLGGKISLEQLASLAGLSQSHFSRSFSISAGMTPHRYLLKLRIETATSLIGTTDEPIAEIAQRCGFCNQSHMTIAMKQHYNVTPGEIRRRTKYAPVKYWRYGS